MIDFLISFLQKFKSYNFTFLSRIRGYLLALIFGAMMGIINYAVYENFFLYGSYWGDMYTWKMVCIAIIALIQSTTFIHFFIKTPKDKLISNLYGMYIPLWLSTMLWVVASVEWVQGIVPPGERSEFSILFWNSRWVILFGLTGLSSLIQILSSQNQNSDRSRFKLFLQSYSLGYYLIFSISICLHVFRAHSRRSETLNNTEGFIKILNTVLMVLLFTTPLIVTRCLYTQNGNHKWRLWRGIISIIIPLIIINTVPQTRDTYLENQVIKANNIVSNQGDNYESYQKAMSPFLAKAYYKQLSRWYNLNVVTFNKLFDATPELYYTSKLKNRSDRNSNATNATKVGKQADTILKLAEIQSSIISSGNELALLQTTYTFHFTNKTENNQEVVINLQSPSQYSVISDLKLGLNLEMQGTIASRGAARKVYEDSLRINKDPALIEKIGLDTYTLRVFPIPSKLNSESQGRQQVQLTILTPVQKDIPLVYSPKLAILNAEFTKDSSLVSKVYKNNQLQLEDIVQNQDIETYLETDHILKQELRNDIPSKILADYCIDPNIWSWVFADQALLSGWFINPEALGTAQKTKISLFLDNSQSTTRWKEPGMNFGIKKRYQEIFAWLKNFSGQLHDVDLFSYNFQVEKIATIEDINYWGYTDNQAILDYITTNNLTNQHIIIVTDDDSFNLSTTENTDRNLTALFTNQIDVVKIGKKVKSYPSDFNSILAAAHGNVYSLNDPNELPTLLNKIMSNKQALKLSFCMSGSILPSPEIQKIIAGYVSNAVMSSITNSQDRLTIAKIQHSIAVQHQIVNQFNSMIALENDRQREDLKKYEQQWDRFDNNTLDGSTAPANPEEEWLLDEALLDDSFLEGSEADILDISLNKAFDERARWNYSVGGSSQFDPGSQTTTSLPPIPNDTNAFTKDWWPTRWLGVAKAGETNPGVARGGWFQFSDVIVGEEYGEYYYDNNYRGRLNASIYTMILIVFVYLVQLYQIILLLYVIFSRPKPEALQEVVWQ